MTDRDTTNLFMLTVVSEFCETWVDDTELPPNDIAKIKTIISFAQELLKQVAKRDGKAVCDNLIQKAQDFKVAIIEKDENLEFTNNFDATLSHGELEQVVEEHKIDCEFCDKKDFAKCLMFSLRSKLDGGRKEKCKKCPYQDYSFGV